MPLPGQRCHEDTSVKDCISFTLFSLNGFNILPTLWIRYKVTWESLPQIFRDCCFFFTSSANISVGKTLVSSCVGSKSSFKGTSLNYEATMLFSTMFLTINVIIPSAFALASVNVLNSNSSVLKSSTLLLQGLFRF